MEPITIRAFSELIDAVRSARTSFQKDDIWWRGQPMDKPLIPSVFRNLATDINIENRLRNDFQLKARSRYSACPDENDRAGWLFLMQHHGLKTRLLDWTSSILSASYFATNKDSTKRGSYMLLIRFSLIILFSLAILFMLETVGKSNSLFERPFRTKRN